MEHNENIDLLGGYILAAEDSLVQAKRLKHFFDSNNLRHIFVKNGIDGLKEAQNEAPSIVISDIIMPEMDGYQFCNAIKQDISLHSVPVILLTSLSDPLDIIKGLQAGADSFITKPYDENYLLSRIKYLITNKKELSRAVEDKPIEIVFQQNSFRVTSSKRQILDLLLSVYEVAISRNDHLLEARRQLQIANDDLSSANKELEAFAHTVSHDLKSPLTGVIGYAEIIKLNCRTAIGEKGTTYLNRIIESGHKMSRLIEDLLHFSKSARTSISSEDVNLTSMANEIISELIEAQFNNDYKIEIQPNISITADRKLIRIVLQNLLGNALKYCSKSEQPTVIMGCEEMNNRKVIFIQDNGVGFDMENSNEIFKPFIRFHKNNEFQGTGVGLSTVKRIIDRHGGTIWFNSKPGIGTTFYFTI